MYFLIIHQSFIRLLLAQDLIPILLPIRNPFVVKLDDIGIAPLQQTRADQHPTTVPMHKLLDVYPNRG